MLRRLAAVATVAGLSLTAVAAAPASAATAIGGGSPQCAVYDLTTKLGFDYAGNPYDC